MFSRKVAIFFLLTQFCSQVGATSASMTSGLIKPNLEPGEKLILITFGHGMEEADAVAAVAKDPIYAEIIKRFNASDKYRISHRKRLVYHGPALVHQYTVALIENAPAYPLLLPLRGMPEAKWTLEYMQSMCDLRN